MVAVTIVKAPAWFVKRTQPSKGDVTPNVSPTKQKIHSIFKMATIQFFNRLKRASEKKKQKKNNLYKQ